MSSFRFNYSFPFFFSFIFLKRKENDSVRVGQTAVLQFERTHFATEEHINYVYIRNSFIDKLEPIETPSMTVARELYTSSLQKDANRKTRKMNLSTEKEKDSISLSDQHDNLCDTMSPDEKEKERQILSFATTALQLLDSKVLESEVTAILASMVPEDFGNIQTQLEPLGWSGNQFRQPLTREDIGSFLETQLPNHEWCYSTATEASISRLSYLAALRPPVAKAVTVVKPRVVKLVIPWHDLDVTFENVAQVWVYAKRKGLEHKIGRKPRMITLDKVLYILLSAGATYDTADFTIGDSLDKNVCSTLLQRIQYPVHL